MMKKFSISSQLLILVFTLLLSTSVIFIIITYFSLQRIATEQAVSRMFSIKINNVITDNTTIASSDYPDMPLYYIDFKKEYVGKDENNYVDGYKFSDNAASFITKEEYESFLNNVLFPQLDSKFNEEEGRIDPKISPKDPKEYPENLYKGANIYKTNSGATIYYFFSCNKEKTNYTFIFTDNTFVGGFIKSVTVRMFSTFLAILFVAVMCIYYWSTRVTRRLKNIQNHILDLPKNKYEKEYVDNGEDEIGDLSRSVEEMRKEIGHNEKTKQEMLQNLSHDFKTPIAVIKSYAEAIEDGMAGDEAIGIIIEQADLLKKKVNRLLQYNSLEYLTKDKPFEEINMTELVNRVVTNYKFQTSLNFNLDLEDDIIFMGYEENWSTVVENIIDNATRYAKREIKITLRNNCLRIYNDGEAIDEQFLNSVFRPYEKGSKGQFGLGMSIVKKTIDFFGMNLSVRNEEGGGVSFIINKL